MSMKKTTKAAILKYGFSRCIEAASLCDRDGEGASTVATYLGLKTANQSGAAINAGRDILDNMSPIYDADQGVFAGEGSEVVVRSGRDCEAVVIQTFFHPRYERQGQPFEITGKTLVQVKQKSGLLKTVEVKDLYKVSQ
jgi:hypothetical protein